MAAEQLELLSSRIRNRTETNDALRAQLAANKLKLVRTEKQLKERTHNLERLHKETVNARAAASSLRREIDITTGESAETLRRCVAVERATAALELKCTEIERKAAAEDAMSETLRGVRRGVKAESVQVERELAAARATLSALSLRARGRTSRLDDTATTVAVNTSRMHDLLRDIQSLERGGAS